MVGEGAIMPLQICYTVINFKGFQIARNPSKLNFVNILMSRTVSPRHKYFDTRSGASKTMVFEGLLQEPPSP